MRVLLLHNPGAGQRNHTQDDLVRMFIAEGHQIDYMNTKKGEISVIRAELADIVAVAGGDGTVGRAVRALSEVDRPLLILPLGTANNIARSLGLPMQTKVNIRACDVAQEQRVDLGFAKGPWGTRVFLEGVGLGALAEMMLTGKNAKMDADEKQRYGKEAPQRFVRASQPKAWQVRADGQDLQDRMLLLEVLNMPVIGPALKLGSGGWPDDGKLCLSILRPMGRDAFAEWLAGTREGPVAGIDIMTAKRVEFVWNGGVLRIDDFFPDAPDKPQHVSIDVARQKLRVLVPSEEGGLG